jgi:hypothetical protein
MKSVFRHGKFPVPFDQGIRVQHDGIAAQTGRRRAADRPKKRKFAVIFAVTREFAVGTQAPMNVMRAMVLEPLVCYALERATDALDDLRGGTLQGAAVLCV